MAPQVPAIIGHTVTPPALRQADTDQQIIETWVARHESIHTRGNYRRQAARLLAHVGKPLGRIRVSNLQAYLASLADQAPAMRANAASAIKSLFSFAHELGYPPSMPARLSRPRRLKTRSPSASCPRQTR